MRFLVALLALTLPAFAQIRYSPTGFTAPFISTVTDQASAQAYLGIGGGTNSPTLNGTNAFTGPNTFAAASFFPQNKIHERQLFATGGIYIDAVYTNASNSTLTNNGGSSVGLQIFQVTLPPLLSSNSLVVLDYSTANTNANASSAFGYVYIGAATNFIYDLTFATTAATRNHIVASALFSAWSQTQQFSRAGFTALNTAVTPVAFADTSTNWVMTFVISTPASHTNLMISRFTISERTGSP